MLVKDCKYFYQCKFGEGKKSHPPTSGPKKTEKRRGHSRRNLNLEELYKRTKHPSKAETFTTKRKREIIFPNKNMPTLLLYKN